MRALSIRSRLVLLFTLQIILIIVVGGVYLDWRLRETLENELSDKLSGLASAAALQIEGELLSGLFPGDEQTRTYRNLKFSLEQLKRATGVRRVYIFSPSLSSLVDTRPGIPIGFDYAFLPLSRSEKRHLFAGTALSSTLFRGEDGRLYKTGFAPIYAGERVIAGLGVEGSAATLEAVQVVRRDLLVLGLIVLAGAVGLGLFFAERLTTPLNRLKHAATRIASGDYETAIRVDSRDEIGFLGRTLEEMRRAIVQRDLRQKAMLAGVAHEIRNPLGGIELFAGLLAAELRKGQAKQEARKIQQEVQNLKRIVNDFLEYARPHRAEKQSCRVRAVFDEVTGLLAGDLDGLQVEFVEHAPHATLFVDPQHLRQILLNLVRNAAQGLDGSGTIRVEVPDATHLTVSDTGPGIAPELLDRIFEPFFSIRSGGTGLGLAVVKSLVEENGGTIGVVCTPSRGARFEIAFGPPPS